MGVKKLATFSDGKVESNPRHLRACLEKLKRLQRAISRKQKDSCNRKKAVGRLATLHRRVANQRANTLHQFTSRLARTKAVVVIEDLNVAGMLKNHHLAQAIGDVGFAEFRRQLTLQGGVVRLPSACRQSVGANVQGLFRVRVDQRTVDPGRSHVQLPGMRLGARPRSECRDQSSQFSQTRRQFVGESKRLWRGRRWPRSCGLVKRSSLKQEPDTFDASA